MHVQVNDGNAPAALPLPISADLEEAALLPGTAQGLTGRGQLPPMDPAPPSNLTPSLAQGGQPYSAAQQVPCSVWRSLTPQAKSLQSRSCPTIWVACL